MYVKFWRKIPEDRKFEVWKFTEVNILREMFAKCRSKSSERQEQEKCALEEVCPRIPVR